MAPRKSRAVGEDDQCPMLKLIMEKGPLSGQTFDFRPGSVIRIGRVVRGNTLSIKDAGISSKHLLIQVEAAPDTGGRRWTVTDLGSSNGTVLNGDAVEPSAALSDDDTIKIGEQTSIIVKFEANCVENEGSCKNVRRNARRGVRGADLRVIDELSQLGLGNKEDEKKSDVEVKNVGTRRTRNSRKDECDPEIVTDLSVIEGKRTRKGGRPKKILPVKTIPEETEKEESSRRSEVETNKSVEAVNSEEKDDAAGMGQIPEETKKEEPSRRSEVETNKSVEAMNSGENDDVAGLGSTSGVKESTGKEKMVADLQNMTLGQWFDFLEVYLPQQIIDETEEMIAEMRRKAERFHEFMMEQQKAKGNSEVAKG